MGKIKKGLLGALALASLPLAYIQTSKIKFDQLFKAKKTRDIMDNRPDNVAEDLFKSTLLVDLNWLKNIKHTDLDLKSYDGLRLHAIKTQANDDHKIVILLHAVNNDHYGILHQAHIFSDLGYDTVMCDMRAHGKSEGEYTSLGFKEGIDLAEYVQELVKLDPQVKIGLYGISLGAQAVLQYLIHDIKENIEFIIVEGAFISPYEQLAKRFTDRLLFKGIDDNYRRTIGVNLDEVDAFEAVMNNNVPILFLHAKDDPIVDSSNAEILHAGNYGPKKLYLFDSKTHLGNYLANDYPKVIENFIKSIN